MAILVAMIGMVLGYQNCGAGGGGSGSPSAPLPASLPTTCSFNGATLNDGATATAYQNSTEPFGTSCVSEVRTCTGGALTGSFAFGSCTVGAPADCLFNGVTINHGSNATAYQNSTVVFGDSCSSESRACTNGSLSGSYSYDSCTVGAPADCLFDGQTVNHGSSVSAFLDSGVAFGSSCQQEARGCTNGVLSGSYAYSSCNVAAPDSCLFDGQTVAHGQDVTSFLTSTVPHGSTCTQETRTCNNGTLGGSYNYSSCNVDAPASCLFDGQTVAHGETVVGFQTSTVPFGSSCTQETRTCDNGNLDGSYSYASCNVDAPASCLFNGQTLAHGESANGFQNSTVPFGSTCSQESRTCSDGNLDGSFAYDSCTVDAPASCLFNAQTVAHGETVTGFQTSTVAFGLSCIQEDRTCNDGALGGSYDFASCNVDAPASCLFNGQTLAHGENVLGFQTSTVAFGSTCNQEDRTCGNGTLSGSYAYASCNVDDPASCLFNGQTVAHGQNVVGFQAETVAYNATCSQEDRTCNNGTLSGSFAFNSCAVTPEQNCTFNSQPVPGGSSVVAYSTATVAYNATCLSQTRTCTDGTLSGTYTFGACSVTPALNCTFNGSTVLHGATVTGWKDATGGSGGCKSQPRTCTNGVLSGSFAFSSCN
jgi:hypothetical protein